MTDTDRCEPPPEWRLMAYECVPPQVVADDLLGVLTDLAHNPTADATIINSLRRARANVQTFTPPATVAALVEALEWMIANDDTNEGDTPLPEHGNRTWNEINDYWIDGLNKARAALALYREAGR